MNLVLIVIIFNFFRLIKEMIPKKSLQNISDIIYIIKSLFVFRKNTNFNIINN